MTTPDATFDAIADLVAAVLSVPRGSMVSAAALRELAPDSLVLIEMAIDLQEEFGVILDHDQLTSIHTFGDLVSVVQGGR